jgi:hypothetical protein
MVEVERQLATCIEHLDGQPQHDKLVIRSQSTTYFRRGTGTGVEQRFALTTKGCLGFVTHACVKTDDGPFFIPLNLCRDLSNFITLAATYYEKAQFYGDHVLSITLKISEAAQLYPGTPTQVSPNQGSGLFDPPLASIRADDYTTQIRVVLQPITTERLKDYLEAVMNDMVRGAGCVLSSRFGQATHWVIEQAMTRSRSAPAR